jgi:hypothetical protein
VNSIVIPISVALGVASMVVLARIPAVAVCDSSCKTRAWVAEHVDNPTTWERPLRLSASLPVTSLIQDASLQIAKIDVWDDSAGLTGFVFYNSNDEIVDRNGHPATMETVEGRYMWPSMLAHPTLDKWRRDHGQPE